MISSLTEALHKFRCPVCSTLELRKFRDRPTKPGELTLSEWMEEVDNYCDYFQIPNARKVSVITSHLEGQALNEVRCHEGAKKNLEKLINILERYFGSIETLQSLQQLFYNRTQLEHESLAEFSRELIQLYDRSVEKASNKESEAFQVLRNQALIGQFVAGARNSGIRLELKRIQLNAPNQTFEDMREAALQLLSEFEAGNNTTRGYVHESHACPLVNRLDPVPNILVAEVLGTHITPLYQNIQQSIETIRLQTVSSHSKRSVKTPWRNGSCRFCGQRGHTKKNCKIRLNNK